MRPETKAHREEALSGWDELRIDPALSPSRLAARALMTGFPGLSLNGSRYLDFEAGDGAGLVACAVAFPEVHFTCASPAQSTSVKSFALQAKAQNVEVCDINLAAFEADIKEHDFIVASDVFAAATTAERMALLVLTKQHLAPDGIACIGIDVFPGGKLRDVLHELISHEMDLTAEPVAQVASARERMRRLAEEITSGEQTEHAHLLPELERLSQVHDAELYRDLLNPRRRTCAIEDFFAMAAAAKLQVAGDADPLKTHTGFLTAEQLKEVQQMTDEQGALLRICQSIDQNTNVRHRKILLVHADRARSEPDPAALLDDTLFTSSLSRSDPKMSDEDLLRAPTVIFEGAIKYQTSSVVEIITLALLEQNKQFPVGMSRLAMHVISALKKAGVESVPTDRITQTVAQLCLKLLPIGGLISHQAETRAVRSMQEKPLLSPLALHQVRLGQNYISSLSPHRVSVDASARFILERLDGTQSAEQVIEELVRAVAKGDFVLASNEPTPEARARATFLRIVTHAARSGLLIG
ncbi:MAG: hypothetical protein RLN89_04730 [Parvibaculum sp.]